ncbi:Type I restriction enzyme R protein N terminus (HSDR_N) [Algoriphagus faecimaris]|uniref:Type I restriction enzyme R protein N terminus (HSDR_N) n=2 Tax=Algoriphagus faecimaris TaxID=686796 RepID=A0A1G6UNR2_9BACT|nr:Type I restriction enzyme R protein N terminus (HSDR_N) [Algoriphagus faecimaris]
MNMIDSEIQLPNLNLPEIQPQLKKQDGKLFIYDFHRKRDLILTPEEWVRQHWISFLLVQLNYPKGLLSLEKGMKYNQLQKRTDVLVFDQSGSPYLIIECKAPQISINQKTLEQACLYHSTLKSKFLILSNGMKHVSLRWIAEENRFEQLKSFPEAPI